MSRPRELQHTPSLEAPLTDDARVGIQVHYSRLSGGTRLEMRGDVVNGTPFFALSGNILSADWREKTALRIVKACERHGMTGMTVETGETALSRLASTLQELHDGVGMKDAAKDTPPPSAEHFLDAAPPSLRRPLSLIAGCGYAVVWAYLHDGSRQVLVVRDDGTVFSETQLAAGQPLDALGLTLHFTADTSPDPARLWSGAGAKRYLAGERPDPAQVFEQVRTVCEPFLVFERSLDTHETMVDLLTCMILSSWFLDAFPVIGYGWATGEMGSGKTNLLIVVTELSYLGRLVLSGGTYATLRDEADWGATLGFDEAEETMGPKGDPDKKALMLAGNRKGATVPFKEPNGVRGWCTRYIDAYCPKWFGAIKRPTGAMASRSILWPMVRATKHIPDDPTNYEAWPHDRRRLIDDLWALGLAHVGDLPTYFAQVPSRVDLLGRDLEPWRAVLAVALWLQERYGKEDLFTRLALLAQTYQDERPNLEYDARLRLHITTLVQLFVQRGQPKKLVFSTKDLTEAVNALAIKWELASGAEPYTNAMQVGQLLRSLRLQKSDEQFSRGWEITSEEVIALALSYSVKNNDIVQPPNRPSTPSEAPKPSARNPTEQDASDGVDGLKSTYAAHGAGFGPDATQEF